MLFFKTLLIPIEQALYTLFDFYFVCPTEGVELGDIDELAHSAIGLGNIKLYGALEAYGLDNKLREFTDAEFFTSTYIDMAVANLAKTGDIATAACAMVTVNSTIGGGTEMNRAILFYSDDVTEVDVEEYMHTGISHVLGPKELTEGLASAPQYDSVIKNTILG